MAVATKAKKIVQAAKEEEETPKAVARRKAVAAVVTPVAPPVATKKAKDPERSNGKAVSVKPKKGEIPAAFKREGPSARDYVTRILVGGAPRAEVKKRAQALAAKEGADVSFKTFDVSYFIKHLTDKLGYTIAEKKDGTIKATAPKS